MNNPTYLIVGATSDLAVDYLNQLDLERSNITLVVRNKSKLNFDKNFECHEADLNKLEDLEKINFNKKFDKVVFFAGIDIIKPLKLISLDEIITSFNVNIISIIVILKSLTAKNNLERNSSIVILNSISGTVKGPKGHLLYSSSKSAINGLVKSFSNEFSKRKIRINSICLGLVKTKNLFELNKSLIENIDGYEKQYPLGLGSHSDVNNIVSFLLSEKSCWITGQNFIIDGGLSTN